MLSQLFKSPSVRKRLGLVSLAAATVCSGALISGCGTTTAQAETAATAIVWKSRDPNRPHPPKVETKSPLIIPAPSDALVLFDGSDLSLWENDPANGWTILEDGTLRTGGHTRNYLATKQTFGDLQIHLEFMTPSPAGGTGQKRGNSGVFLMGLYELQIMDPINNQTFADGLPGSVFGQNPPAANAARKPGQWQSYDIIFTAPRFSGDTLISPPKVTALLNGILVQSDTIIRGDTIPRTQPPTYATRINEGPLVIQDHGDATGLVRFRNIWVRPLNKSGAAQ